LHCLSSGSSGTELQADLQPLSSGLCGSELFLTGERPTFLPIYRELKLVQTGKSLGQLRGDCFCGSNHYTFINAVSNSHQSCERTLRANSSISFSSRLHISFDISSVPSQLDHFHLDSEHGSPVGMQTNRITTETTNRGVKST